MEHSRRTRRGSIDGLLAILLGVVAMTFLYFHPAALTQLSNVSVSNVNVRASEAPNGWSVFAPPGSHFLIDYPDEYTVDTTYSYAGLGSRRDIKGVKFIVPESTAAGTNLVAADSGVSVEVLPDSTVCAGAEFVDETTSSTDMTDSGVHYSVVESVATGAADRFDEIVYAVPGSVPCTAVRYSIHSIISKNASSSATQPFDKSALLNEFNLIRRSFTLK